MGSQILLDFSHIKVPYKVKPYSDITHKNSTNLAY